jgi:large subunit ribosomal protein L22
MEAKAHQAKAVGRDLPISTKQSIEICNMIRGRELQKSKEMLLQTIKLKKAIPFKRFNQDTGHKRNIGPGRYPQRACRYIYNLLESVEINAQNKGLDTGELKINSIIPNKASTPMHSGRLQRRKMRRTHIEIIVEEKSKIQKDTKTAEEKPKIQKDTKTENKG